jgi:hypothetical protein
MNLFHFAPQTLGPGSIIEPGNFGRLLYRKHFIVADNNNPAGAYVGHLVARELAFELVRRDSFFDLPSRMSCVFCCPTVEDAKLFAGYANRDGGNVLHEVEPVDDRAPLHRGYISHCDYTIGAAFLEDASMRAKLYWSAQVGDPAKGQETLVGCAVRVIRAVN